MSSLPELELRGNRWNCDRQWLPLPITVPVVAFFLPLICIHKQECIPVGCILSAAEAVCWEVSAQEGVSACQGGVHLPSCGQTDTCENITFPQLQLWMVTNKKKLGRPLSEWRLAVAFSGTQVLNSNSI